MEQLAGVRNEQSTVRAKRQLRVALASSEEEILAAQKLRWRIFADELGVEANPVCGGERVHYAVEVGLVI